MKATFVTPRYGTEVVGGAEHAARMLAENLAAQTSWEVEALSSCALDAASWSNVLSPGQTEINGVTVRRFPTTGERGEDFPALSARVHRNPALALPQDEQRWIDSQGPLIPQLLDTLKNSDSDVYIFYPYLYYPTVRGLPLVAQRSIMHPAAHDELPLHMSIYARVFAAAAGFVFQTDAERHLVEERFSIAQRPQLLLGLGVESQNVSNKTVDAFRAKFNLGDSPYLLCLGRVDEGKGSVLLLRYFAQYKQTYASDLKLVFVGPVMQDLPLDHPDVVVTGIVSDEEKWAALQDCAVLVSPSPYEAFSIALIEGWAAGRPVLVNAACLATQEHVERSHGGLSFDGYGSFQASLHKLLTQPALSSALAKAGQDYVDNRFRWKTLTDRYSSFLEQMVRQRQMAEVG